MKKHVHLVGMTDCHRLRDQVARANAQRKFSTFVKQGWSTVEPAVPMRWNWHLEGLCQHLEAVADGRIRDILINVPPGTMKSLLTCVFWPAWIWARRPENRFIFASYSDALTMRDNVRCRYILESDWYQKNWPITFRDDQNTKGLYETSAGGWRMATSIGGKMTGLHPDYIVVDDPHNAKNVDSENDRASVKDWWDGTVSSRGATRNISHVVIMQRLHDDDLSAHLIAKGSFEHIRLPMRYEEDRPMPATSLGWKDARRADGELLWPQLYTEQIVKKLEIDMGPYHSAGQLQQRPAPRGGGMFKREWLTKILTTPPSDLVATIRYWDKSGTAGGDGARTAGVLVGRRASGRFVILNVVKGRWSAVEREAVIKATATMDSKQYPGTVTWMEQEPGSGGKESAQATVMNLAGYSVWAETVSNKGSKVARAEPLACQAAAGNLELLAGPWTEEFIQEAEMFPNGKLKDQIDAGGGALNKLRVPTGAWDSASIQAAKATGKPAAVGGPGQFDDKLEFSDPWAGETE